MALKLPPISSKPSTGIRQTDGKYEIYNSDTGIALESGIENVQSALAKQNQITIGSTPSLSGRPDLYAIEPTAQEKAQMQPIVPQAGMAPVMPQVASGAQLQQIAAGTLPTYAAEQIKPQIPTNFADAARLLTGQAQKDGKEEMYGDTSSKSFDNQLLIQQGLLYKQLFGESLTPAELRVLSPSQQAAVREGNQNAIKAELSGIGSVVAGREEKRKEEETKKEKEFERAKTTLDIYSKLNLWDKISPSESASLEQTLGLAPGTLVGVKTPEKIETQVVTAGGRALLIDKNTGKTIKDLGISESLKGGLNIIKIDGKDYQVDESGNLSVPQVPTAPTSEKVEKATEIIGIIEGLIADKSLGAAVGPISSKLPTLRGGTSDFEQKYDNFIAKLSLENLNLLKGPMSDKDLLFIKDASAALSLKMSEKGFKAGLEEIKKKFENIKSKAEPSSNISPEEIEQLKKDFPGKSEEEIRKELSYGKVNSPIGTGARTDRHNNPTAFTTDIAKQAGLKLGVDYEKGDSFGNGKFNTAKIIGDPIDKTIDVINKVGFQTSSGSPRWSYIDMPKSQWDQMDYGEKKHIIGSMYQQEGGNQLSQLFA